MQEKGNEIHAIDSNHLQIIDFNLTPLYVQHLCMYVCMYVCVYVCIHVYVQHEKLL